MVGQEIHAFCIHGHFYQPPREDPLTNLIPDEPGASPFKNWNERIHHQCYRPNAEQKNFEGISFNIGPTLAAWMAEYEPDTFEKIIAQDHANVYRFGVGNAMAQAYNHSIMPLATHQDKITQVIWGIEEFRHHFYHTPAGMWLPETAVDLDTLDIMAQNGIQFTILAPWQAEEKNLDVTKPYWVECYEGRKIAVFFYHQELSTRVSFDPGATANADEFVLKILLPQYVDGGISNPKDQYLLIASDGEAYGHHHPFREKFLAYLIRSAARGKMVRNIFPGLWLQSHPPIETMRIRDNTSWSCHHGISRWKEQCACTTNSKWKKPFRDGLDQLAEALDQIYVDYIKTYAIDSWELRNQFIKVKLGQMDLDELLKGVFGLDCDEEKTKRISLLLAAQYERQRMFTSCGWFFDEFARIEPKNNVRYAAQAVWLTRKATGDDVSDLACEVLGKVISSRTGLSADAVFDDHIERLNHVDEYLLEMFLPKRPKKISNW